MRRFGLWAGLLVLASYLVGCGGAVPRVTPTLAPTRTPLPTTVAENPSPTPILRLSLTPTLTATLSATETLTQTATASNTPEPTATATFTFTPSPTVTGTQTPSATPTNTPRPSSTFTPTVTNTATQTATVTASPSPSPTVTASVTPLIFVSTDTPTATLSPTPTLTTTPSPTLAPSITPSATATQTASATVTPDLRATQNAELLQTRAVRATFTAVPLASPTNTLIPPTLDVTPTLITATPGGAEIGLVSTPIPSTPIPATDAPTQAPVPPTPTSSLNVGVPDPQGRPTQPVFSTTFNNTNLSAYVFSIGAGNFVYNGVSIVGGVTLFAGNPADSRSYVRTDERGLPSFVALGGGGEQTIGGNPYYDGFAGGVSSAQDNKNFIRDLAWSPNGRAFSFVIQPPSGTDTINAGAWFWSQDYGRAFPLLYDCPNAGYSSCGFVQGYSRLWETRQVEWAPNSARALLTVWLTQENRFALVVRDPVPVEGVSSSPAFLDFENGHWWDNERLLVSGLLPDRSRSIIGLYNLTTNQYEQTLFETQGTGLWMQDAVRLPNGQVVALGRPDGTSALRLYTISNGSATPLSDFVGNQAPERIEWEGYFSAAVLTVGGVQYRVDAYSGQVRSINTQGTVTIGG